MQNHAQVCPGRGPDPRKPSLIKGGGQEAHICTAVVFVPEHPLKLRKLRAQAMALLFTGTLLPTTYLNTLWSFPLGFRAIRFPVEHLILRLLIGHKYRFRRAIVHAMGAHMATRC